LAASLGAADWHADEARSTRLRVRAAIQDVAIDGKPPIDIELRRQWSRHRHRRPFRRRASQRPTTWRTTSNARGGLAAGALDRLGRHLRARRRTTPTLLAPRGDDRGAVRPPLSTSKPAQFSRHIPPTCSSAFLS
jgi:hypothetical protein